MNDVMVEGEPEADRDLVRDEQLARIHRYWSACNHLALGMLYLQANPLLREPLCAEHIKARLLGHWGSDPGQSFVWVHLNRVIKKFDLKVLYTCGPGHGAPRRSSWRYGMRSTASASRAQ